MKGERSENENEETSPDGTFCLQEEKGIDTVLIGFPLIRSPNFAPTSCVEDYEASGESRRDELFRETEKRKESIDFSLEEAEKDNISNIMGGGLFSRKGRKSIDFAVE